MWGMIPHVKTIIPVTSRREALIILNVYIYIYTIPDFPWLFILLIHIITMIVLTLLRLSIPHLHE